jgi:Dolichyl-phosphate-mannose-protein mannosyltransferase
MVVVPFSIWIFISRVLGLMSDNAQLAQQRLILLDATLVFSMAMSIWMYVRFYRYRHMPFSRPWWTWLIATGVSLSFVMSTKYVGLFTFVTIGSAVAYDLWNLLDYRRGLPMVIPHPTTFPSLFSGTDLVGRICQTFCRPRGFPHRAPLPNLPLLVLPPLCNPHSIRPRRRIHVPLLPSHSRR